MRNYTTHLPANLVVSINVKLGQPLHRLNAIHPLEVAKKCSTSQRQAERTQLNLSLTMPNHFIESRVRDGKFKTIKKLVTLGNCVDAHSAKRLLAARILPEIRIGGCVTVAVLQLTLRGKFSDLRIDTRRSK